MVLAGLSLIVIVVAGVPLVVAASHRARRRERLASALDLTPSWAAFSVNRRTPVAREVDWVRRGIEREEASRWIAAGVDADHAFLFKSLQIGPETAGRLREAGFDESDLITLLEDASFGHRVKPRHLEAVLERAPRVAPAALAWVGSGVDVERAIVFATAGFAVDAFTAWKHAGWTPDDALPWFVAGFEPENAAAWRDNHFTAQRARTWKRAHFGVKQAVDWQLLGETPEDARVSEQRLRDAGITIATGLHLLYRGLSLEEICAGGALAERAFSNEESFAWLSSFTPEEAMQWLDAGVRDPAEAERLRREGVRPHDAHRAIH